MSSFPGLARYDAMQRAPLGTYSALRRPSPVASQYKRQSEMYGQALRTLSRAARRGDANAAITAIGLRDKANADGYTPGGIGRSEDFGTNVENREQELMRRNQIAEQENSFTRGRLDRRYQSEFDREPVNPGATTGAGYGTPLRREEPVAMGTGDGSSPANARGEFGGRNGDWIDVGQGRATAPAPIAPRMTFAEQDAAARKRSEASGAFGRNNWWSTNRI